jgi:hypothetical protein
VFAEPLQAINHPATVATSVAHDEVIELCKLVVVGNAHSVPLWTTSRQRNLAHNFAMARRPGQEIRNGGAGSLRLRAVMQIGGAANRSLLQFQIQRSPKMMTAPVEVFALSPLIVFPNPSSESHRSRHRESPGHDHYCT